MQCLALLVIKANIYEITSVTMSVVHKNYSRFGTGKKYEHRYYTCTGKKSVINQQKVTIVGNSEDNSVFLCTIFSLNRLIALLYTHYLIT